MSLTDRQAASTSGGFTAVPNFLIDKVMPALGDTEWRLLVVILRQTIGRKCPGSQRRKESDWMTQSQLKSRTGRASEAVSRAVDALVRRGLVDVLSSSGERLDSAISRRGHHGRTYYRLSRQLLRQCSLAVRDLSTPKPHSDSEHRKPNTTKQISNKRKSIDRKTTMDGVMTLAHSPNLHLHSGWQKASDVNSSSKKLNETRF